MPSGAAPRSQLRRMVQREAGAWGIMKVVNDAFIQPLLIAFGASQIALGIYISGSSLFTFGAGWLGPTVAGFVGSARRFTLGALAVSRTVYVLLTLYLLLAPTVDPYVVIGLAFIWCIGEGFALPMWTTLLTGMVSAPERGRWVAMRAQAATIGTVPVLFGILLLVLFASKEQALPIAYAVAAIGGVVSWFSMRHLYSMAPNQTLPPRRSIPHFPSHPDARQFLGGVFIFWFGSALTWPIIAKYLTDHLHAPTAYFAISQILGAFIALVVQPRWGKLGDRVGTRHILLLSAIGSATVPLFWAFVPVFWLGFLIDGIAYVVWPGHMLGLTLRAVELADNEEDRPMMLGWTNLMQGAGACLSPLIAAVAVSYVGIPAILIVSCVMRLLAGFIMSDRLRINGRGTAAVQTA